MKIKQLEKGLTQVAKEVYTDLASVKVNEVVINNDYKMIGLKCTLSIEDMQDQNIQLCYPDGKGVEFVKGMFYTIISSNNG